jgi:hypothetical protein
MDLGCLMGRIYLFVVAIRVATQWYQEHLGPSAKVILLTNDMDNRSKARESGIVSETGTSSHFRVIVKCSKVQSTDPCFLCARNIDSQLTTLMHCLVSEDVDAWCWI